MLTGASLALALRPAWQMWLAGQLMLALALVQWFVLMHECGHGTLFRTRALNLVVGHVAGFIALIPFAAWQRVHRRHHRWTGWQDVDPTTASLVPRVLSGPERAIVNTCWRLHLPLFALLYRSTNFWNLARLARLFPHARDRWAMALNAALIVAAGGALVVAVGAGDLVSLLGLALLLGFIAQESILLSQHTHIPMRLARAQAVRPHAPLAQQAYTRSLRLPRWLAFMLLNFDAHELHHMYVQVPGHALRRIECTTLNEVHWWRWLRQARRTPGEVFLFRNRSMSGLDL
jgi:fatty acid desaturase